jgi:hypothetical protein
LAKPVFRSLAGATTDIRLDPGAGEPYRFTGVE